MDLSRLSDEDLKALSEGRLQAVSDRGLRILSGEAPPEPKEGIGAALVGGTKGFLSRGRTAVESVFDPEGAARRGVSVPKNLASSTLLVPACNALKMSMLNEGFYQQQAKLLARFPALLQSKLRRLHPHWVVLKQEPWQVLGLALKVL